MSQTGESIARDELRLGLILNGGTSLAVWMGGVTDQIDAVRCAGYATPTCLEDDPILKIYSRLLDALRLTVVVDVMAATSAGGVNGTLLSAAIKTQTRLAGVRELWLDLARLTTLVHDPGDRSPRSILKGEEVFLPDITQTLTTLLGKQADTGLPNLPNTARLLVTGTDVAGVEIPPLKDSFGDAIELVDHRLLFRFCCGTRAEGWCPIGSESVNLLARAARTSASFPFAFEPSEVKITLFPGGTTGTLQTRSGALAYGENAPTTRWLIDGGALDNSPITPLLNEIQRQPAADVPVRRTVIFVIPYASLASPDALAPAGPGLGSIIGTTFNLPRDVPALDDIGRLEQYVRRRDRVRHSEDALQALDNQLLSQVANDLLPAYRRARIEEALRLIAVRSGVMTEEQIERGEPVALPTALAPTIETSLAPVFPPASNAPAFAVAAQGIHAEWSASGNWQWGGEPLRRAGRRVLDRIREARASLPIVAPENLREQLRTAQQEVHMALWQVPQAPLEDDDAIESAIVNAASYWSASSTKLAAQQALVGISGALTLARRAVTESGQASPAAVQALLLTTVPYLAGEDWTGRLLALEVITTTVSGAATSRLPDVGLKFMRLSADATPPEGVPISSPGDKLYGLRLGHFAGFVAEAWRANDWMWGRLDGATRLIDVLLDEGRIREAGITNAALAQALDMQPDPQNGPRVPDSQALNEWRRLARQRLHSAILGDELAQVASLFDAPNPAMPFSSYVAEYNGAQTIDSAVARELELPQALPLVAGMVKVATRMAKLPWRVGFPLRLFSKKLARMLIDRM